MASLWTADPGQRAFGEACVTVNVLPLRRVSAAMKTAALACGNGGFCHLGGFLKANVKVICALEKVLPSGDGERVAEEKRVVAANMCPFLSNFTPRLRYA